MVDNKKRPSILFSALFGIPKICVYVPGAINLNVPSYGCKIIKYILFIYIYDIIESMYLRVILT